MSVKGNTVRACVACGHGYLKPCDGANAKCGNLQALPGRATAKAEAQEGKKPRKGKGYRPGKDILAR